MTTLALIDYGSGNLHSAEKALARAARDSGWQGEIAVTSAPEVIAAADRVVLPGVGAFGECMRRLTAQTGIVEAMREVVTEKGRPFLGICVGMQLLADEGLEHGTHKGLGWISGAVGPLPHSEGLKLPHMGWNTIEDAAHPVLPERGDAYFVHSYAFSPTDPCAVVATATHGVSFPAAVAAGTILGTQFHPEKSQAYGLKLLANFLDWRP